MKRILSYFPTFWRNQRRQVNMPRFLTYTVTFSCNARCIMCDSWRKPSPNDLSLQEIENIFDQLPRMDAVRLTGGEPFVRKDMLEIAHLTQEKLRPLILHVTTNGFLTDRIVQFCEERNRDVPLSVLVSVDGMKDKHNTVRGHDKAWDFIVKTLESLAPRQKALRMSLAVNQTIVDAEGVEHYKRLRDFLKPLGIRNNVVMAYDVSATYNLEEEIAVAPTQIGEFATFGEFTEEHLKELFDEIDKDLGSYPLMERVAKRYYLLGIRNRLLGDKGSPNPKCVALNSHLRIFPDGRVPTCQFNTSSVGNLREQNFSELWANDKIQKQREWVYKCPGCWAECEVLPSAIYTGDLLKRTLFPNRV